MALLKNNAFDKTSFVLFQSSSSRDGTLDVLMRRPTQDHLLLWQDEYYRRGNEPLSYCEQTVRIALSHTGS